MNAPSPSSDRLVKAGKSATWKERLKVKLVARWWMIASLVFGFGVWLVLTNPGRGLLHSPWGREIFGLDRPWGDSGYRLRKVGHFVVYAGVWIVAWSLCSLSKRNSLFLWSARRARDAFLLTVGVAMLDEWHQTFVPGRIGCLSDVIIDAFGAASAAAVAYVLFTRGELKTERG